MGMQIPITAEEIQRNLTEHAAAAARKPVESRHALATINARSRRNGKVVSASTGLAFTINGEKLYVAQVGDTVRYPDGTETTIVSGAGLALCHLGKPVALVGSHLANGDVIVESPQSISYITQYADEPPIPGLLQPGYVPPPSPCVDL